MPGLTRKKVEIKTVEAQVVELKPDCQYIFIFDKKTISAPDVSEFDRSIINTLHRNDFSCILVDAPNTIKIIELPSYQVG